MGSAVSGIGCKWDRPSVRGCASLVDWQNALATLISTILYNMMGYVEFPLILHKIVDDHGHHELGEFKTTIMGMLDTCGPWRRWHAAARTSTARTRPAHTSDGHARAHVQGLWLVPRCGLPLHGGRRGPKWEWT